MHLHPRKEQLLSCITQNGFFLNVFFSFLLFRSFSWSVLFFSFLSYSFIFFLLFVLFNPPPALLSYRSFQTLVFSFFSFNIYAFLFLSFWYVPIAQLFSPSNFLSSFDLELQIPFFFGSSSPPHLHFIIFFLPLLFFWNSFSFSIFYIIFSISFNQLVLKKNLLHSLFSQVIFLSPSLPPFCFFFLSFKYRIPHI